MGSAFTRVYTVVNERHVPAQIIQVATGTIIRQTSDKNPLRDRTLIRVIFEASIRQHRAHYFRVVDHSIRHCNQFRIDLFPNGPEKDKLHGCTTIRPHNNT